MHRVHAGVAGDAGTLDLREDRATVEEIAHEAGMSTHAFYRGVRSGHIPPGIYWRIGRSIRVSRSRLAAWLAAGGSASDRAA